MTKKGNTIHEIKCAACGKHIFFTREKEDLQKRIEELEAENERLREALKEIAEFANDEYGKMIPAPVCVKFRTIDQYAEKVLKGAEQ